MTTVAQAWDELIESLEGAGLNPTGDPNGKALPCAIVISDGVEIDERWPIGRRQAPAIFRVLLVAGAWDQEASARALAASVQAFLTMAATLVGWGVGPVQPAIAYALDGGTAIGSPVTLSRMVDF